MLYSGAGKQIMQKTRFANSLFSKFKGLMFETRKNFDYALIFPFSKESRIGSSIHMMFVFFPIDTIFLDKNKIVVDKSTLNPWLINYTPKKSAKYLIELPQGKAKAIGIGEKLSWD